MIPRNWRLDTAKALALAARQTSLTVIEVVDILDRHIPMAPDTAYMPVPRCETCKHWSKDDALDAPFGDCLLLRHGNYARDLGISRLAIADFQIDAEPDFITQASFGCVQWKAK